LSRSRSATISGILVSFLSFIVGCSSGDPAADKAVCAQAEDIDARMASAMSGYPTATADFQALPGVEQLDIGLQISETLKPYTAEFEALAASASDGELKDGLLEAAQWTRSISSYFLSQMLLPAPATDRYAWAERCEALISTDSG
jgi:hypothetical protein